MIQVIANETNDQHDKGEVITKLNRNGEAVLEKTLRGVANDIRPSTVLEGYDRTAYEDTINLYVSLFGRRLEKHHSFNKR
jgi:hypothetical protein